MAKWERGKRRTIREKKQWKKNGKLKLCNKAPPILRRDHHYFLCKWPQGFQSFLSLMNTPEASVNTIKRVRFFFLSPNRLVWEDLPQSLVSQRGAGLKKWLKNCQNKSAPPLNFILLMGESRTQTKRWHGLSPSLLLRRKERMVRILVEEFCIWNCPAGVLHNFTMHRVCCCRYI